jgi:NAD(P)H-quinone oxidoreductase subunit 4L
MTSSTAKATQDRTQAVFYAIAYAVATMFVVGAYATGSLDNFVQYAGLAPILESWQLKDYTELLAFILIVLLGSTVALLGGQTSIIMAVGTVGSFFALTFNQHPLIQYLTLAAVLFAIGLYGMVVSRNAVRVLMSIELMLNAVNINLVAFARYVDPVQVKGQLFAIFVITVAAAEAAVGLAIVLSIYRNTSTVDMERFNLLKW